MKKQYIIPSIVLVKAETEGVMLDASNFSDTLDNNGVTSDDITSKHHKYDNLWDESWENEEEE